MVFRDLFLRMMFKPHKMENKEQQNILFMAIAGIGLYLFFKKKSTIAPVVPPTTGGGSELQPIAPSPVYNAPVQPIYAPTEPVYIEPTQPIAPSPISTLPVFTNPISDIISIMPVQQIPAPAPIYQAPVQPIYAPSEPIFQEPIFQEPIQTAPIYSEPNIPIMDYNPIYDLTPSPINQPAPIYFEPSPVFYYPEPSPINVPEPVIAPEPINTPEPSVYYQEPTPVLGDTGSYYLTETFTGGGGGLFDFINNQVWLGNLTTFEAESYMAIDTTTKDTSDQA
jgi:hypothetical protein